MNLTRTLIIGMTTIALLTATAPAAQAGPLDDYVPLRYCEEWIMPVCEVIFGEPGRPDVREACEDARDLVGTDPCAGP